jgi:hypothetical protein
VLGKAGEERERKKNIGSKDTDIDLVCVAVDVVLLLCAAMVLKDRKEQARYRLIDAKNGSGPI